MKSGSRNCRKGFDGGVGSVYGMFIIALILCLFLLSLRKRNVGFFFIKACLFRLPWFCLMLASVPATVSE